MSFYRKKKNPWRLQHSQQGKEGFVTMEVSLMYNLQFFINIHVSFMQVI